MLETSPEIWTVQRVLQWTVRRFTERRLDAARLDAELLLCHVLQWERVRLYTHFDQPLTATELAAYRALIKRRLGGEPVAYLLGRRDFYQLTLKVDARVLIPRPETEHLVDAVLQRAPLGSSLLDVCTGSGAIALACKKARPDLIVTAIDLSHDALAVAEENRAALGLDVRLMQGDLFAPIAGERFACIVANPPYIPSAEIARLSPEVRKEPQLALDGGASGLAILERLIDGAEAVLSEGGWFACELGQGQAQSVAARLRRRSFGRITTVRDFAGIDRCVLGQLHAIDQQTPEPTIEPDEI